MSRMHKLLNELNEEELLDTLNVLRRGYTIKESVLMAAPRMEEYIQTNFSEYENMSYKPHALWNDLALHERELAKELMGKGYSTCEAMKEAVNYFGNGPGKALADKFNSWPGVGGGC